MVVPVLMTSCHVSEKPKSGPLTAHMITTLTARMKVDARPAAREVRLARAPKNLEVLDGSPVFLFLSGMLVSSTSVVQDHNGRELTGFPPEVIGLSRFLTSRVYFSAPLARTDA
jgi:hypothetical protein